MFFSQKHQSPTPVKKNPFGGFPLPVQIHIFFYSGKAIYPERLSFGPFFALPFNDFSFPQITFLHISVASWALWINHLFSGAKPIPVRVMGFFLAGFQLFGRVIGRYWTFGSFLCWALKVLSFRPFSGKNGLKWKSLLFRYKKTEKFNAQAFFFFLNNKVFFPRKRLFKPRGLFLGFPNRVLRTMKTGVEICFRNVRN